MSTRRFFTAAEGIPSSWSSYQVSKMFQNAPLSLEPDLSSSPSDTGDEEDDPELTALIRLIECPICKDVPIPPIYNCQNGHLICDSCRVRLVSKTCGYCCGEITRMRNYPVESLVSTPSIKCDYIQYGCSRKLLSLGEYEDHVRKCWAKHWRPGKITFLCDTKPDDRNSTPENLTEENTSYCSKCSQPNSFRKVKCGNCNSTLRSPTPMFGLRKASSSPQDRNEDEQQAVEYECEYITSIWRDLEESFQDL